MFALRTRLRRDVETLVEIFGQVEWNVGELGRYSSLLEVFGHLNKYCMRILITLNLCF
jgi:hypothetical protein